MTKQRMKKKIYFLIFFYYYKYFSIGNPSQLLENLVTVGANIDTGEEFKRNVQEAFGRAKNRVYSLYIVSMEEYQNKYELISFLLLTLID